MSRALLPFRAFRAILLLVLTLLGGTALADDWTNYGNGPEHTGYYPRTIGSAPFVASWSKAFTSNVNQVAVASGVVYGTAAGYHTANPHAFALEAETGAARWTYPLADASSINGPSFADGRLYFQRNDSESQLWCLNAAGGTLAWAAPFAAQWETFKPPTVVNGSVFINGGTYGGMYGFHAATGSQLFYVSLAQEDNWTPAVAGGVVYSCTGGKFLATNPANGNALWSRQLTFSGTSWYEAETPVVSGQYAVVRGPGRLVAMNLSTREVAWSVDAAFTGTPAVAEGVVYAMVGGTVRAYQLSTGTPVGTYTASGALAIQPIVTKDLVLVASASQTFVFDRATFTLRQTLPKGGALTYSSGRLFIAGAQALTTYTVTATEADPAGTPPALPPLPSPEPNPQLTLGPATTTWLDAARDGNIAYFLFASPAKVERFDLATGTWLTPFSLRAAPTAFRPTASGIYVAFGSQISKFALDGSTETKLGTAAISVGNILEYAGRLFLTASGYNTTVYSMDAASGRPVASVEYFYTMAGPSLSPTQQKIYGTANNMSPSDIVQVSLTGEGVLLAQKDSPHHGDYPTGTRTYVLAGEQLVADNAGMVYHAADLKFRGSLAGAFVDGDFSTTKPVLLRNGTLHRYGENLVQTGVAPVAGAPTRLFLAGDTVYTFGFETGRGAAATSTPLASLVPAVPSPAVDPNGLIFTPDAVELGPDNVVYLLSKQHKAVFRWSVAEGAYLPGIPLLEAPSVIAFAAATGRLYLGYESGRISYVEPAVSLAEVGFANLAARVFGLEAAGDLLFAADPSGAWATHYVFSPSGALLSSEDWNYYSKDFIWNAANRRIYHFRDDTSPNDLLSEEIDLEGKLGTQRDSPYHGDYTIRHPLRVSPAGRTVLLGNGDRYHGLTLAREGTLGFQLVDAGWSQNVLATLKDTQTAGSGSLSYPAVQGVVQTWGDTFQSLNSATVAGTPLRLLPLADGWLAVTSVSGRAVFTVLEPNLTVRSSGPAYVPKPPTLITQSVSEVTTHRVRFQAQVNPQGSSTMVAWEYGVAGGPVIITLSVPAGSGTSAVGVSLAATGLAGATTYQVRAVASSDDGVTYGDFITFTTPAAAPVVWQSSVSTYTATSAQIATSVHTYGLAGSVVLEYGLTSALGSQSAAVAAAASPSSQSLSLSLAGLQPSTKYYYRTRITTSAGEGRDILRTFTTAATAPTLVTTGLFQRLSLSSVRLHGSVVLSGEETLVYFQYGPLALDFATAAQNIGPVYGTTNVQAEVTGLIPGQTYLFRLVAQNAHGTFYGDTLTFQLSSSLLSLQDDRLLVPTRKPVEFDPLANDVFEGARPTIISTTQPFAGTVELKGGGLLRYAPGADFRGADVFTYTARDSSGLTATAQVYVTRNVTDLQGTYYTLLGTSETFFAESGALRIHLAGGGVYTGALRLGATSVSLRGTLDGDLGDALEIRTPLGTATLALQFTGDEQPVLQGTVTLEGGDYPFTAQRTVPDSERELPLAGRYTFWLAADGDSAGEFSTGFATMQINAAGFVALNGRTADALPFSATSYVGADYLFPLYTLTTRRKDQSLHGWVSVDPLNTGHHLQGGLGLSRLGSEEVEESLASLDLLGHRYVRPVGGALALGTPVGHGNIQLGLTVGEWSSAALATLTGNKLTSRDPATIRVSLNPATGLFSGTAVLTRGQKANFAGVLVQGAENHGRGYAVAGWELGALHLTPIDPIPTDGGGTSTGGSITIGAGTSTIGAGASLELNPFGSSGSVSGATVNFGFNNIPYPGSSFTPSTPFVSATLPPSGSTTVTGGTVTLP